MVAEKVWNIPEKKVHLVKTGHIFFKYSIEQRTKESFDIQIPMIWNMYVFMSHETSYKKVWVSMSEKEEHNHKI